MSDGSYTEQKDCDEVYDYMSYQVGLLRMGDFDISSPHGPSVNAWQWNAYGGDWHLMAGEEGTKAAATEAAMSWIRDNADETMSFLMRSRKGR